MRRSAKSDQSRQEIGLTNIDTRFGDMPLQVQIAHVNVIVTDAKWKSE